MIEGDAIEEKLNKELKNFVKSNWDFRVRKMHRQEYMVVFPNKGSLETFTKLSEFQMSLFGLKGRIENTGRDAEASSMLQTIWIRVLNVPDFARDADSVKELVSLVAEPLIVDELSLVRTGPVRVQRRCKNPATTM